MGLFVHRFVTAAESEDSPLPGRYDELQAMHLDADGLPLVISGARGETTTSTKAVRDPADRDPEWRPGSAIDTVTKGGRDTDRSGRTPGVGEPRGPGFDACGGSATVSPQSAVITKTAGGRDTDRQRATPMLTTVTRAGADRDS